MKNINVNYGNFVVFQTLFKYIKFPVVLFSFSLKFVLIFLILSGITILQSTEFKRNIYRKNIKNILKRKLLLHFEIFTYISKYDVNSKYDELK